MITKKIPAARKFPSPPITFLMVRPLELLKSRRHFGEIKQLQPLISRNEEPYISKEAKEENALAS